MTHTPTPWILDGRRIRGNDLHVASAFNHNPAAGYNDSPLNYEANAARIVACVNACEGINPEAVPDMLAALKNIARGMIGDKGPSLEQAPEAFRSAMWSWSQEQAHAAITKAETG